MNSRIAASFRGRSVTSVRLSRRICSRAAQTAGFLSHPHRSRSSMKTAPTRISMFDSRSRMDAASGRIVPAKYSRGTRNPQSLSSPHAAEPFERLSNLSSPRRHFVIAQRALARLELSPHQNRVLARAHFFASENLHRNKTAQLGNSQSANALINLRELHSIVKHKREVALDGREAR